jgi:hypothetical protein
MQPFRVVHVGEVINRPLLRGSGCFKVITGMGEEPDEPRYR